MNSKTSLPRPDSTPPTPRTSKQPTRRPGAVFATLSALLLAGLVAFVGFLAVRLVSFVNQVPLVTNPVEDRTSPDQVAALRQQGSEQLNRQGWIDQSAGLAAIPIEQAIQLITSNAFPNNLNAKPTPSPTATPTITPTVAITPQTVTATAPTTPTPNLATLTYADVLPILDQHCAECHGNEEPAEGLEVTRYRALMNGSLNGSVIKRGDPENSYLVQQIRSGKMPKKRDPLSPSEIEIIVAWIKAGAPDSAAVTPASASTQPTTTVTLSQTTSVKTPLPTTNSVTGTNSISHTSPISTSIGTSKTLTTTMTPSTGAAPSGTLTTTAQVDLAQVDLENVSFTANVLPIFEQHCTECHSGENADEGLELTSRKKLMNGSLNGSVIKAGDPDKSYLVEQITKGKMPKKADPLTPAEIEIIVAWIKAGAKDN